MVILDKFTAFISKITERRWHAASLLKFLGQKVDWPNKGSFSVARASFQNSGEQHYDAIRNTISNLRQVMNWRFIPLRMPTVPCKHVAQSYIGEKKTVSNSCICYCIIAYTIRSIFAYIDTWQHHIWEWTSALDDWVFQVMRRLTVSQVFQRKESASHPILILLVKMRCRKSLKDFTKVPQIIQNWFYKLSIFWLIFKEILNIQQDLPT